MRSRIIVPASLALIAAGAFFYSLNLRPRLTPPSPSPRGEGRIRSQTSPPARGEAHFSDPDIEALRSWADNDPAASASYAEQLPANPARAAALETVAIAWANRDLTTALKWARQWPIETERRTILMAIGVEAVGANPLTALTVASGLTPSPDRDELIQRAAAEWALTAPTAARDWALQITDENLRTKTLSAIAIAWADSDPASAATLAVEQLPPGRLEEDAIVSIIQRWAQQSPKQAAAWVDTFQESELKTSALLALADLRTATPRLSEP
jgi:hypothetical protein